MTRKEAERINHQEAALLQLGFTSEEAEQLRRISLTLHSWHELECGTDRYAIVRGRWDREKQEFIYDDHGFPFYEFAGGSGQSRYQRTPDRESGALRRLRAIVEARNKRNLPIQHTTETCPGKPCGSGCSHIERPAGFAVSFYIQTDPRGAALYIIRPGDVPDGRDVGSYYDRGLAVY